MLEYAEKTLNNYDDSNYTYYNSAHPKRVGIAFFDKDIQPSNDTCVGNVLTNVTFVLLRKICTENGMQKVFSEFWGSAIKQEIHT